MTYSQAALKMALELVHMPSQVRLMRSRPLPDGIDVLLQIATGDEQVLDKVARATERDFPTLRRAADFFIEQILLDPDADSYRVLGGHSSTSTKELRHNMALLVRWLHPDHHQNKMRSVHTTRVNQAWDDVKTAERRRVYDKQRYALAVAKSRPNSRKPRSHYRRGEKKNISGHMPARVHSYLPPHKSHTVKSRSMRRWRHALRLLLGRWYY